MRIEHRFLRRWIEGADNPLLAQPRPDSGCKACAGQFPEGSMAATSGAKDWSGNFAKIKSSSVLKKSGGCDG
jgi:hypothetical protein